MPSVWLLIVSLAGSADLGTGKAHYVKRDFAAAEAELRTVVAKEPGNSAARILLARTLIEMGRLSEAMEQLEMALAGSSTPDVKFQVGLIARELAERRFGVLQDVAPRSAALRELLGRQRELRGRFEEALAEYQAAAALEPDRPGIHYWIGNALWNLRRLEEARARLARELKNSPHHAMANLRLGQVLLALNDEPGAVSHLEFAVQALPGAAEARKALGKAYLKVNRAAEARREWEVVAERFPSDDQIHFLLGSLYRDLGERELAQREFARHREILERRRLLAEKK